MLLLNFIIRTSKKSGALAFKVLQISMAILCGVLTWYFLAPYAAFATRQIFGLYRYFFLDATYDWTISGWIAWSMAEATTSHAANWAFDNAPYLLTGIMSLAGYKITGIARHFMDEPVQKVEVMCVCPTGEKIPAISPKEGKTSMAEKEQASVQATADAMESDVEAPAFVPHNDEPVLAAPDDKPCAIRKAELSLEKDEISPSSSANSSPIKTPAGKKRGSRVKSAAESQPFIESRKEVINKLKSFIGDSPTTPIKVSQSPNAKTMPPAPLLQFSVNPDPSGSTAVSCQITQTKEGMKVSCEAEAKAVKDESAEEKIAANEEASAARIEVLSATVETPAAKETATSKRGCVIS